MMNNEFNKLATPEMTKIIETKQKIFIKQEKIKEDKNKDLEKIKESDNK